jgi:transcriptional regulator with XRE-family HTH domain
MPRQHVTTAKNFGKALRDIRKQQRLTQRELALSVGSGERFIVDLEGGKENIRLGKAFEVAAALGVKIEIAGGD